MKTLEELLKENGIDTNKQSMPNQQPVQQQNVVSQQVPTPVQQPNQGYAIPQQQQNPAPTTPVIPNQQPMVQATIYNPQQPVQQSVQQQNQYYKPTVLMSSEDTNNLDIQKFLGDSTGGGIKLEEDFYLVECVGIELITDKDFNNPGVEVQKYRFSLKVISSSNGTPIEGVILHKKTSLSFGERSNNFAIYKAFTHQVPQGKYNILECKGKQCLIRVENKPSQTGGVFSVITLFAPKK